MNCCKWLIAPAVEPLSSSAWARLSLLSRREAPSLVIWPSARYWFTSARIASSEVFVVLKTWISLTPMPNVPVRVITTRTSCVVTCGKVTRL